MKKKLLAMVICMAMLAISVAGGTMAYFTDADEKTNTFTVGSVDIELLESTLHRQVDKSSDDDIILDAACYQDYLKEAGKNMVPGHEVRKAPYIRNIGKNDAFVRIKMTVDEELFSKLDMTLYTTGFDAGDMVMDEGTKNSDGTVTYTFTYTKALKPDAVTYYAPFWKFKIKDALDNDDLTSLTCQGAINSIIVRAEAIQAEGFSDHIEAFAAFDKQQ